MKLSKIILSVCCAALLTLTSAMEAVAANSFQNSDFIETEQPELTEETKQLMLRLLLRMQLITQEEYERILQVSTAHYSTEKIYV